MQVTLENLAGLERKLNIVVPPDRIESEILKKLQKIAPKAKIAGFRPGKVPFAMVQKRYGDSVRGEVIENLVRETYVEALKQEKLNPVGMPKIEIVSAKQTEPFSYNAIFEIYPEVNLIDFSELEIEKPNSQITEDDINEVLTKLRKEHTQWKNITDSSRKSKTGDQLRVDFTLKNLDDPAAENKTEKNVKFVLGDGSMWSDFEKHLYGVSSGEEKTYTVKFPDTHVERNLAGKNTEFAVTIAEVCEPILPDLDDEFAKKLNIKDGGVEALKVKVHESMERDLQHVLKNFFKKAITDKLLDNILLEAPKVMVENELDRLAEHWQSRFTSYRDAAKPIPEFPRKDFVQQAKRSVILGMILAAIVKENQIKVEEAELREYIKALAAGYKDAAKVIDWYFADQNRLLEIKSVLLEEKAIEYLAKKIKAIDKAISYKEAMEKR